MLVCAAVLCGCACLRRCVHGLAMPLYICMHQHTFTDWPCHCTSKSFVMKMCSVTCLFAPMCSVAVLTLFVVFGGRMLPRLSLRRQTCILDCGSLRLGTTRPGRWPTMRADNCRVRLRPRAGGGKMQGGGSAPGDAQPVGSGGRRRAPALTPVETDREENGRERIKCRHRENGKE